jgi:6-phosphogluconolactonase
MAVSRYPDLGALAKGVADELKGLVEQSLNETFACHLVLSGGSTPKALYKELVARGRDYLPWDEINLWWGDERCVPPDHADSNFGMANAELIKPLGLDSSLWHRMKGELPPEEGAKGYEDHIYNSFGDHPKFNIVFLGLGTDGHTLSLFPGAAIDPERIVITTKAPNGMPRISMTPKIVNVAHNRRFLAAGGDKAHVLAAVVKGTGKFPAQLIADASWHVDEAAAAKL